MYYATIYKIANNYKIDIPTKVNNTLIGISVSE